MLLDILLLVLVCFAVITILYLAWVRTRYQKTNAFLASEVRKLDTELNAATTERVKLRRKLITLYADLEAEKAFNKDLCGEMAELRRAVRDYSKLQNSYWELSKTYQTLQANHTFLWERATELFMKQEPSVKVSTTEAYNVSFYPAGTVPDLQ